MGAGDIVFSFRSRVLHDYTDLRRGAGDGTRRHSQVPRFRLGGIIIVSLPLVSDGLLSLIDSSKLVSSRGGSYAHYSSS
jgi:hypothetical protein